MTILHIAAKQQEIITIAIAVNPCGMRGKAPGKFD
jgi:hypothetical protein